MLGAIVGDIVGSVYEFDCNAIKTKDFPLFGPRSIFTDDSVMTAAVADVILSKPASEAQAEAAVTKSLQHWGSLFPMPGGGYGSRFAHWLRAKNPAPYGSFGNGSAMRVSPVAWLLDRFGDVELWAAITARVTHNHPEGIKGAQATA
ncbi:MAG: ADP-ribosylglycohydrolase family protein, partial [Micrococcales bacterium]|nr:ADP-ribosylglycohydrolase family protein [Micrococcales bacterium]